MRYLNFVIAALLLCTLYSFSYVHKGEPVTQAGVAYYHFTHLRDTNNPHRIWNEDFILVFNNEKSMYTSSTRIDQDSANLAKMKAAEQAGSVTIQMGVLKPVTTESVFIQNNAVYVNKNMNEDSYIIREPLEKINWTIEKETKQLLGYTCQKATGTCKGRKYIAWFTTDIPAGFGPWKLQGLPGLILEASDVAQRIKFTCTSLSANTAVPHQLSLDLPLDGITTTQAEYQRMEKAFREGISMDAANGSDIKVENVTMNGASFKAAGNRNSVNYPLELAQ